MNGRPTRVGALCAWLLASAACGDDPAQPRTEVLLQVDADSEIRARADQLTLAISSGAGGAAALTDSEPEVFDLKAEDFHWPASLALIAKPSHEDHIFEVTLTAEADAKPLARGRVRSGFLKGKTVILSTSLFGACIDMFGCSEEETCVAEGDSAKCVSADVDRASLPVFVPDGAAGSGGNGSDSGREPPSDAQTSDADMPGHAEMDAAAPRDASSPSEGGSSEGGSTTSDASQDSGTLPDGGSDAGPCVPTGPEQCWNSLDDDCNGQADCADPACGATATCAPASSLSGVLIAAAERCPDGYTNGETLLYQGLNDPGCTGCNCSASQTLCSPRVYYYSTATACGSDIPPYGGGTLLTPIPTYTCSSTPIGDSQGMATPIGWRVTMTASPATCNASGSAQPAPPTWSMSMKLCSASTVGNGCQQGFMCVPRMSGAKLCGEKSNSGICPSSSLPETWQRGVNDRRSCGGCSCIASGGDCNNVTVQLGHDWGCGQIDGSLHGGEKSCAVSTYMPPAILAGLPTPPTCNAMASENGTLTPSAPIDLCCSGTGPIVVVEPP